MLALLPTGSTSNEALHAELNSWFRNTPKIHSATLSIKLDMLKLGKMQSHNRALYHPTARQEVHSVVFARCLIRNLWTAQQWKQWCKALQVGKRTKKADLPQHQQTGRAEANIR